MSEDPTSQEQSLSRLKALIDDIRIASLVTLDSDGALRSRPMATLPMTAEPELWFFTNDYSAKVDNVLLHPQVCVSYAAPEQNRYVSISGTAELIRDADKMKQLWKPALKAWFPQGVEDPDLALLCVDIVSAQCWDGPSSKLVQIFGLLKAMATGESASRTIGQSEKLTVRDRIGSDTAT